MKEIDSKIINSIEELEKFIKGNNVSDDINFVLGQLNEQQLVAYLYRMSIGYERIGFKQWKISFKRPTKGQSVLIRKIVLIVLFVLLIALMCLLFTHYIVSLWIQLEEWSKDYSVLVGIISTVAMSAISGGVVWLFRKKVKKLYHLYMG